MFLLLTDRTVHEPVQISLFHFNKLDSCVELHVPKELPFFIFKFVGASFAIFFSLKQAKLGWGQFKLFNL